MRFLVLASFLIVFINAPAFAESNGWNSTGTVYSYSNQPRSWNVRPYHSGTGHTDAGSSASHPASHPVWAQGGHKGRNAPSYDFSRGRTAGAGKPVYTGRAGGENRPSYEYGNHDSTGKIRESHSGNIYNQPAGRRTKDNLSPVDTMVPYASRDGVGSTYLCPADLSADERSRCLQDLAKAHQRIRKKYD